MKTRTKFIGSTILSFMVASVLLLSSFSVKAQESESPFSIGTDVMSRYVWRGGDIGAAPSIQPSLEYSKGGFGIGAWGAFSTLGTADEIDLYAYYTIKDAVTLTVTDYYIPGGEFFTDTLDGHIVEAMVGYAGGEDLPIKVTLAMNIAGDDKDNSLYGELGYSFKHLDAFVGFGNKIYAGGDTGIQGVNFGVSSSKEIKITDSFALPVSTSLIMNPNTEKIFFVVGFSL